MRARRAAALSTALLLTLPAALASMAVPAAADETISTRIDDGDPTLAAITVSQLRFTDDRGSRPARHVVLSRDDDFADTLAGSPLTGQGPLLYTASASLTPATGDEIDRVLAVTGRVYVLGGPAAVSDDVVTTLRTRGYDVRRLRGTDRIGTSLAIADEVRDLYGGREVLMARARGVQGSPGSGWADSVAGGARAADQRIPVLLTDTSGLDSRVDAWLDADGTTTTHLLGGTAALSQAVADAVPGARRHRGPDRTGTAAAIATGLWGASDTGARAFTIIDAAQDRGWAFGLAAAGLAADRDAPVLTTIGVVTPATRRMVATCGTPQVDLTIVGDGTLVSGAVREYLDDLDGEGCGPDRTLTRKAGLRRFEDCVDLLDWYRTNALERVTEYGLGGWYGGGPGPQPLPAEEGAPTAAPSDAGSDAAADGGSRDVSGTNVQEVGVDEPDVLKTDGDVLAVVAQDGSVDLLDLTGTTPRLAANLPPANQYGQTELLLIDDVLTTLTTTYDFVYFAEADMAFAPGLPQPVTTTVTRWNVANPDEPRKLSAFEVDGSYRSARMIEGVARMVVESGPHGLDFTFPKDNSDKERQRALDHNRRVVEESTLANWLPSWGAAGSRADGSLVVDCADVHEPPAWSGFDAITVITFDTRVDTEPGESATVVAQGQNVYASLDRLLVTTGRWGAAFEGENLDSVAATELHAFDITSPTDISYVGSGKVDGYVINQFALSEHGGDIRVAATKQPPWRCCQEQPQQESSSFVAVLQERGGALAEVGRVGGLGKGEQIQSVRFYGDLGIVVTFRQIDPLYLLDMSDSTRPVVTGELKDTGFSQYLHLVGEDLLMGVGVDADEDGRTTGAMVALYDISNRAKPTRVARINVPDAWSPVGGDHRAFLFWPGTDDAFVPMSSWAGQKQGEFALVLRVDEPGNTMSQRGRLTHQGQPGVDDWRAQIRRSFIVDGNAYTVSWAGLARHDLATLATTSFTAFPDPYANGSGGSSGSGEGERPPVEVVPIGG